MHHRLAQKNIKVFLERKYYLLQSQNYLIIKQLFENKFLT